MKKTITLITAALIMPVAACSGSSVDHSSSSVDHSSSSANNIAASEQSAPAPIVAEQADASYANFLKTYISEKDGINFVAYGDVTPAHHAELKAYITSLEQQGPAGMSDGEIKAYWFNVYNAKTIDIILDNYPLKSIRSLGALNRGPWDKKVLNVKGVGAMSLNDVEHGTLRKMYKEPRIHYAVNCASYGCPNLKSTIWKASTLEADLTEAAVAYINHPRGVRVENGKVIASKIFDWYKVDFGNSEAGMLKHFRQYAKGDLARQIGSATDISKFEYNWDLNE